jgi:hypothetical protein
MRTAIGERDGPNADSDESGPLLSRRRLAIFRRPRDEPVLASLIFLAALVGPDVIVPGLESLCRLRVMATKLIARTTGPLDRLRADIRADIVF